MEEQEIKRMWLIDSKIQLGDKLTDEEREFFNSNFEKMRSEMEDNWTHWQFHSGTITANVSAMSSGGFGATHY